jgi:HPr kinase/phosphorylase
LVGDDRIDLNNCGGRLIVRGHRLIRGLVERRGLGLVQMPHELAVVVRLVVDIVARHEAVRFPEPEDHYIALCGVQLPVLTLLEGAAASDSAISVLAYLERAGRFEPKDLNSI